MTLDSAIEQIAARRVQAYLDEHGRHTHHCSDECAPIETGADIETLWKLARLVGCRGVVSGWATDYDIRVWAERRDIPARLAEAIAIEYQRETAR